jgi:hypothetical protein
MTNDFESLYASLEPKIQAEFSHYAHHLYAPQKAILKVLDGVQLSVESEKFVKRDAEEQADKNAVTLTKKDKNTLNALSDLRKWLFEFLTVLEHRANSFEAQFLTLQALQRQQLNGAFAKKAEQLRKALAEHPSPDMWLVMGQLRLSHWHYFNVDIDKLQDYQSEMSLIIKELDDFYFSAKLKYSTEIENRMYILDEKYDVRLSEEMLKKIEKNPKLHPNIQKLYLPLFYLTRDKSESDFNTLKSFLETHKDHEVVEKSAILYALINFTLSKIRQGDKAYFDAYFEVLDIGLKQSLFTVSGYFPTDIFTNTINLACHYKELLWAENFIKDTSIQLDPTDNDITTSLALARIRFEQKRFGDVLVLLQKVSRKNMAFNLNGRVLLIRALYEMKESNDLIIVECTNLSQYLDRNNVGVELKESAVNFLKIIRKLIKNQTGKNQLFKELNSTQSIYAEWLSAKIDEVKT